MKKINWERVLEFTGKIVFFIIAAGTGGFAFFMLFNMIREVFINW
jgi:hypothetical protein